MIIVILPVLTQWKFYSTEPYLINTSSAYTFNIQHYFYLLVFVSICLHIIAGDSQLIH